MNDTFLLVNPQIGNPTYRWFWLRWFRLHSTNGRTRQLKIAEVSAVTDFNERGPSANLSAGTQ